MPKDKRTDYKRSFNEKNYARLAVTVPIFRKADVEKLAKQTNDGSVNGLINDLLRDKIGMTEQEWRTPPKDSEE